MSLTLTALTTPLESGFSEINPSPSGERRVIICYLAGRAASVRGSIIPFWCTWPCRTQPCVLSASVWYAEAHFCFHCQQHARFYFDWLIKGSIPQFLFSCDIFRKYFDLLICVRDVKMCLCERQAQLCIQMSSLSHNKYVYFPIMQCVLSEVINLCKEITMNRFVYTHFGGKMTFTREAVKTLQN